MPKVKQQFFKTAGGQSSDQGLSLTTNCKRLFVTGFISGPTATDFKGNVITTKNAGDFSTSDAFVAGLTKCGSQKFFKTASRPGGFAIGSSIISDDCKAYVAGSIAGPTAINFNDTEIIVNSSTNGLFVAGLNNCGDQKFFVTASRPINFNNIKLAQNCKRVFVTSALIGGAIPNVVIDFDGNTHLLNGMTDILVAGLDHDGHQKFFKTAGSVNLDSPFSLAADDCNVYVTGYLSLGTATDFDGNAITTYGNRDIFVAGLNNCGDQKFFTHAGTTGQNSQGNSISVSNGDIFVTGFIGSGTAVNFDGESVPTYGAQDIFVAKLDKSGHQKFFKTAGGISNDNGFSIVSNDHGVFLTGFINSPTAVDFAGHAVTVRGSPNVFVAGLNRCGKQIFFRTAGNDDALVNTEGISIVANEEGIYVTGIMEGLTGTDFNGCPIKNLQGSGDIFVAKLDYSGCQKFFLTAGSQFMDFGAQILIDSNEIYVTGRMGGTTGTNFCHCPVTTLQGNGDVFVARLDDLCSKFNPNKPIYVPL